MRDRIRPKTMRGAYCLGIVGALVVATVTFFGLRFAMPTGCNPFVGRCDSSITLAVLLQAVAAAGSGVLFTWVLSAWMYRNVRRGSQ